MYRVLGLQDGWPFFFQGFGTLASLIPGISMDIRYLEKNDYGDKGYLPVYFKGYRI